MPGEHGVLSGQTIFKVPKGTNLSSVYYRLPNVLPNDGYIFNAWEPELSDYNFILFEDIIFTATYESPPTD